MNWISAKHRLPEPNTMVLGWFSFSDDEPGIDFVFFDYQKKWCWIGQCCDNDRYDINVTHWMPIPEGPGSTE